MGDLLYFVSICITSNTDEHVHGDVRFVYHGDSFCLLVAHGALRWAWVLEVYSVPSVYMLIQASVGVFLWPLV